MYTPHGGSILVGVDGSDHSTRALTWSAAFGGRLGLPITAAMAWEYPPVAVRRDGAEVAQPEAVDHEILAHLERVVEDAGLTEVACEALRGPAHKALAEASARPDVAMLVLGTRGLGPILGLMLGSVSRSLLFHARCPLILVPPGGTNAGLDHVVAGIDGSPISGEVTGWSAGICRSLRAAATILRCVDPGAEHSHELLEEIMERSRDDLETELCGPFRDAGVAYTTTVTTGDARRCLVESAERHSAGLIVIGQHGAGRFDGLGGTGSYLSRHSPLPLAIIPRGAEPQE